MPAVAVPPRPNAFGAARSGRATRRGRFGIGRAEVARLREAGVVSGGDGRP